MLDAKFGSSVEFVWQQFNRDDEAATNPCLTNHFSYRCHQNYKKRGERESGREGGRGRGEAEEEGKGGKKKILCRIRIQGPLQVA